MSIKLDNSFHYFPFFRLSHSISHVLVHSLEKELEPYYEANDVLKAP